jgi:hypothetical protein
MPEVPRRHRRHAKAYMTGATSVDAGPRATVERAGLTRERSWIRNSENWHLELCRSGTTDRGFEEPGQLPPHRKAEWIIS